MATVACPECESSIQIQSYQDMGDEVECPDCHEAFEIAGLDPIELDIIDDDAEFEDEDFDFD